MESFAIDPTVLPDIPERKGTLFLRSDHMKYGRATLNSNWHKDREAEPKDYDVSSPSVKRDLLRATYVRIGNVAGESPPETTTQEAMSEVHKLQKDFTARDTHKTMVTYDNFAPATAPRDTGNPDRGYNSVLPRHRMEHDIRHLETTHSIDYQYPYPWSPQPEHQEEEEGGGCGTDQHYRHCRSEFTDTDGPRRRGQNTWQDCSGAIQDLHH